MGGRRISRRSALRRTHLIVGLPFLCGAVLFAQGDARVKGATIEGVVTRSGTGEPVHEVLVTVSGASGARSAVTDDKGRFMVAGLAPGAYKLEASATLFVRARKNRLNLAPDQRLDVDVQLT